MKSNDILASEVWDHLWGRFLVGFFVIPILNLFHKPQEILSVNALLQ